MRWGSVAWKFILGVGLAILWPTGKAMAIARPTLPRFQHFIDTLPDGTLQHIPESHPGLLYGGRVAGNSTIVHLYPGSAGLVQEKIEVAIPDQEPDSQALWILARFLNQYEGLAPNDRLILGMLYALRGDLLRSGKREWSIPLRGDQITLSFDNSAGEMVHILDDHKESWTYLYWRADIQPIPKKVPLLNGASRRAPNPGFQRSPDRGS